MPNARSTTGFRRANSKYLLFPSIIITLLFFTPDSATIFSPFSSPGDKVVLRFYNVRARKDVSKVQFSN
jgi:hypothetical protein